MRSAEKRRQRLSVLRGRMERPARLDLVQWLGVTHRRRIVRSATLAAMQVLSAPAAALACIGRQGPRALAAGVLSALALPALDALLRPFVTEAIFALLCVAFLRVDIATLRGHIRKPGLVIAATAWTSLVLA